MTRRGGPYRIATTSLCAPLLLATLGCATDRGPGTERPLTWEVVRTIGSVDGSSALSDVIAAVEGPSDLVVVSQWQHGEVVAFDTTGSPVGRFGRSGSGPGEFLQVASLRTLSDTVGVEGANHVAAFAPDGRLVAEARFRIATPEGGSMTPRWYAGDGRFGAVAVPPAATVFAREEATAHLLLTHADGRIVDTIARAPSRTDWFSIRLPDGVLNMRAAEFAGLGYAVSPGGDVVVTIRESPPASGGAPRLVATWIGLHGDTVAERSHAFDPRPFPTAVIDRIEERVRDSGGLPAIEALREDPPWPAEASPFSHAVVARDHALWLRREAEGDSARWERWRPSSAEPPESVWFPAGWEVHYADGNSMWVEEPGEFDVPYLRKIRLSPGVGG